MNYTPNWNKRKYSKNDFALAWTESKSIAECARKLKLTIYGSTYKTLQMTAESLSLTNEHMTGQGWNTLDAPNRHDLSRFNRRPLSVYLTENSHAHTSQIKSRIIKEGLLVARCSAPFCAAPEFTINGLTGEVSLTPLTLDHINGDNRDNRIENLRLLCANCDRFTPTFCRGKKEPKSRVCLKKENSKENGRARSDCECGNPMSKKSNRCRECEYASRKGKTHPELERVLWPSDSDLLKMVKDSNFSKVGKNLGVSDNAVRKRLRVRKLL